MIFNVWEWVRLVCYAVGMVAGCYMIFRMLHRHDKPMAMLFAGIAGLFAWYLFDLTMVSVGASTRETRSFATPLTVFAVGGLTVVAVREVRLHRAEKQVWRSLRRLSAEINGAVDVDHG